MGLLPSSTRSIPDISDVPRHIAVIMDGNGRWAKQRFMPRIMGHQRGVETLREVIRACRDLGVEYLTVFAFSSENWRRPLEEVNFLMSLFMKMLEREVANLHRNDIRLRIIGDRSRFDPKLVQAMTAAEQLTAGNKTFTLTVAANYGGRWDVMNAVQTMLREQPGLAQGFSEEDLTPYLSLSDEPEPDLFIRTGGEQRISNFMLWQLAYTELYFTEVLWPEFTRQELELAISSYRKRERRFGRTSEQLKARREGDDA
ncbi:MAG: isoprenyl transferase [Gallionella sp.]|jgi:undecaprenyl diphosphate synthase|nr:isoprenyl transferase [Gallionella sp.]